MENLRSTCALAEMVLGGKDIELLLLKKDVEEKLSILNGIEVKNLPDTVAKTVNYVPGGIDFGYLQDQEGRPLSTTAVRLHRIPQQNGGNSVVQTVDAAVQTLL